MTKNIKKVLKWLICEYVLVWLIVIMTFVAGEMNLIPNGLYCAEGGSKLAYYLNVACVVVTLSFVVLSLKLFTLNTHKSLKRMNHDEALSSYHLWSVIRIGMLMFAALFGIVLYFLLLDTIGILCACIDMVVTMMCVPSEEKINTYIEQLDNNVTTDVTED